MQAYYPNGSPYRNLRHAFATIYQDGARAAVAAGSSAAAGGIRSLYRGVGPTTIRGIVLSGTQICSYDQIKQSLKKRGIMQEGVSLHFVASTFAGYAFRAAGVRGRCPLMRRCVDSSVRSPQIQSVSVL